MKLQSSANIKPIRAFRDNYIWLWHEAQNAWIVDPGEALPVIEYLKQHRLTLAGILITHHHADHCAGIGDLLDYVGPIPVFGSVNSPNKSISHPLKEGDTIHCANIQLKAIEIPGHTLDHLAYEGEGILFCGDTLFSAGCGKIFEGTPVMMYNSLKKIMALDENTKIYCGHEYTLANLQFAQQVEPHNALIIDKIKQVQKIIKAGGCSLPSLLSDEKNINPFLRCQSPDVINAVEEYVQRKLSNPVEVFTYLRIWKNNFTS